MKKHSILLIISVVASCVAAYGFNVKDDLKRLDSMLDKSSEFVAAKEATVSSLERMLVTPGNPGSQKGALLEMLYEEYFTYRFDDARHALDQMKYAASQDRQVDIALQKARLYCTAGMFVEAKNTVDAALDTNSLNTSQKLLYYDVMQRYCGDYREFSSVGADARSELNASQAWYRNAMLRLLGPEEDQYKYVLMNLLYSEGTLADALNIASSLASACKPSDHEYALYTYFMGAICYDMGNVDDAIHWYVESAICDIQGAVKDNASLFSLAKILIGLGEENRAFRYTQVALEDALFYNARLRPFQIAAALPEIQNAYDARRDAQNRRNVIMLVLVSLLSAVIICALITVMRINAKRQQASRQLSAAEKDLSEAVEQLRLANNAKEEYLGLFLSMCSSYLEKLRKHMSMKEMEEELKVFYNTFDNAFLNLYPDFVNDFNSLLKEDDRIILKNDEILNTELRIFALIKLGITQSSHIASLLRYSVNTIYNYRAQVKKSALGDVETFEERVKNL